MQAKSSKPLKQSKPSKPVKPIKSNRNGPLIAGVGSFLLLASIGTFVAAGFLVVKTVESTVHVTAQAADSGLQLAGKFFSVAVAGALTEGTDEQRIEILNQFAEAEFIATPVPQPILDGIHANIAHENPEVRSAAKSAIDAIESTVTDSDSDLII